MVTEDQSELNKYFHRMFEVQMSLILTTLRTECQILAKLENLDADLLFKEKLAESSENRTIFEAFLKS